MGNPLHYSLELPQRCLQLIERLWPHAEQILQSDQPELGPLTTTFLISMAMPIINLPIERIERYRNACVQGYTDDRHLNPRVTEAIDAVLGGHAFKKAPFFAPGAWSFSYQTPAINIARPLPETLAMDLSTLEALKRAEKMPTAQWCSILRNAMAHGGVAYLDDTGATSYGRPVSMYAFVSGRFDDTHQLVGVNVLRISEVEFRSFLRQWVNWLQSSGLARLAA